eukprot:4799521-Amphidinium_carterae.1
MPGGECGTPRSLKIRILQVSNMTSVARRAVSAPPLRDTAAKKANVITETQIPTTRMPRLCPAYTLFAWSTSGVPRQTPTSKPKARRVRNQAGKCLTPTQVENVSTKRHPAVILRSKPYAALSAYCIPFHLNTVFASCFNNLDAETRNTHTHTDDAIENTKWKPLRTHGATTKWSREQCPKTCKARRNSTGQHDQIGHQNHAIIPSDSVGA